MVKACLNEYLRCAQKVHTIAFFQWRIRYPSKLKFNWSMLRELVEERIDYTYSELKSTNEK